jgi:hypothetical protein
MLALAGCAAPPPPPPGPAYGEVTARFVPRRDDQVIEIRALGPRAIMSAELVLPDGAREPAFAIDKERDPTWAGGPSHDRTDPVDTGTVTLIGQIASVALIRVRQPADYAQAWRQCRIALRLGLGDNAVSQILAAPPPP